MATRTFNIESNIIDLHTRRIGFGKITVEASIITGIEISESVKTGTPYIMPGFIDAHIHIESSMLTPPAFAKMAVRHGTVATISDPHEIANVCGIDGVRYMVHLGRQSGFHFFFGAPSCVPATPFETSGYALPLSDIRELFHEKETRYLAEMMNYPAVLHRDPLVMDKIDLAKEYGLPVDGHAPGLKGKDAQRYASAGITTDHECTSLEEAHDKITAGMMIIIREGSAAKNYNALHTLIEKFPDKVMFCSDDKHPDDLIRGHINEMVIRSLDLGYDLFDVLTIACLNPASHYHLDIGLMRKGDPADFILVNNLDEIKILSTWISGEKVFVNERVAMPAVKIPAINTFNISAIETKSLELYLKNEKANVIVAMDGSIVTGHEKIKMNAGLFESDIDQDILKIAVINRYHEAPPAIGLIRGFGLKKGAIASSVAHDSHNIIAVGTNDADLAACINEIIFHKGGIGATYGTEHYMLPLPIGGLMSDQSAESVGNQYEKIDHYVRYSLGSVLKAPFMTLSFMALLVIPSLKLSDKGLFDGNTFQFIPMQ